MAVTKASSEGLIGNLVHDQKLTYIDTLRVIAILLVIVVHHSQSFTGLTTLRSFAGIGQLGVQLFFVASAFTLCVSMDQRRAEPGAISNFFIRRFFRIAPLYYFAIVFYGLTEPLFRMSHHRLGGTVYTPVNIIANLTFVHSLVPGAFNTVVPGGWSIGTEMAFYAAFPLMFLAFLQIGRSPKLLAIAILAAFAMNFVLQEGVLWLLGRGISNNNIFYCSLVNQLPVFLIGMLLYALVTRPDALRTSTPRDLAGLTSTIVVAYVLLRHPAGSPAIFLPTVGGIAAAFLFNLLRHSDRRPGIVETIGQLSFSIYIFHFMFAWVGTTLIVEAFPASAQAMLYLPTLAATIAGSMLAAVFSKRFIEDPFIGLGRQLIRARAAALPGMTTSRA